MAASPCALACKFPLVGAQHRCALRPDSAINSEIGTEVHRLKRGVDGVSLRVDSSRLFLYDELELVGRLAQGLERSVYTRKVVRSNRTVPTTVTLQPFSGDVVQLVRTLPRPLLESRTVTAMPASTTASLTS
jgi:hypothetical protein